MNLSHADLIAAATRSLLEASLHANRAVFKGRMNATQSCNDVGFGVDRDMRNELADKAIADRADSFAFAWLGGRFDEKITDGESLASIVSQQLCDVPGNEFRGVLGIVQRAARGGDAEASNLIERMANEHASAAYERGSLL